MEEEKKYFSPIIDCTPESESKFIKKEEPKLINPIINVEPIKNPEDKTYIILYQLNNQDDGLDDYSSRSFSVCVGRTCAYNDIKDKLISGLDIDVHTSKVMTETRQTETDTGDIRYYMIPLSECISVYAFCVSSASYYPYDDFNIEDYSDGEVPEDTEFSKKALFTDSQNEYRNMLFESLNRDKFINIMRDKYVNNENNI